MVFRLFLFVFSYLAIFLVPAGVVAYAKRHALAEWWNERQYRLKGKHNALLLEAGEHRRCRFCLKMCSPEKDCYDANGWYHNGCIKFLLGSLDE